MVKIGLLLGSARSGGNADGLCAWLQSLLSTLSGHDGGSAFEVATLAHGDPAYPTHPLQDSAMPALIRDPAKYTNTTTRAFSSFVTSCTALIILTPQYNWGYPGGLKNALDHLYWEWRDKPFMLVSYGGHGGTKVTEQLTQVLEGGLKAKVVSTVGITLPEDYIRRTRRVGKPDGEGPEETAAATDAFLEEYSGPVADALKSLLQPSTTPKN